MDRLSRPLLLVILCIAAASSAHAALIGYWPLDEAAGTQAPNSVPMGIDARLYAGATVGNGPTWLTDPVRGQVLSFDGGDDWAHAGTLPRLPVGADATWSFWTYQQQSANNDVALGNRFGGGADQAFVKFTARKFEYRPTIGTNNDIDYADIPQTTWVHHCVVKTGPSLTYYRDGSPAGSSTATSQVPWLPFYMGGDKNGERWKGRIDDVALWTDALTPGQVGQLASGASPLAMPGAPPRPLNRLLSDDFEAPSLSPVRWEVLEKGLESPGLHSATILDGTEVADTTIHPGSLTLGGTSEGSYWPGMSLRSVPTFDAGLETILSVRRVSLQGSGSAWRSSIWLWADDDHYIHFGQVVGEGGWAWNAKDAGGMGTDDPTGSGNNIAAFDPLDGLMDDVEMALRWTPGAGGTAQVGLYLNGVLGATHTVSNFPERCHFLLSAMPRADGDTVTAVFDDAAVDVVPEPSTLCLLALGGLGLLRRRRR